MRMREPDLRERGDECCEEEVEEEMEVEEVEEVEDSGVPWEE